MEHMADRTIHVLLVEDNPGDVRLIRRMLADASAAGPESQPFAVTCVDTLAGGVRSVHAHNSDVVLLDLSLPDSQGLSTLTRMQAAAPAVPVVVLTGLADESAALAAVQNGAQDYLVKGHVDPYALANSIRYARERKQLLEALREYSASLEERNAELDAFAHTVAHDLKNQVFTVAGNAELLLDTLARPSIETGLLDVVLEDWRIADKLELSLFYRRRATMDSKVRVFIDFISERIRAVRTDRESVAQAD
jgi:DNA-binding NarL/FixJ family response regulator